MVLEEGKRIIGNETKDFEKDRNSAHTVWPAAKGRQIARLLYSLCSLVRWSRCSNHRNRHMNIFPGPIATSMGHITKRCTRAAMAGGFGKVDLSSPPSLLHTSFISSGAEGKPAGGD